MAMGEEQHRQHLEAVMSSDMKLISLAPELDTTSYLSISFASKALDVGSSHIVKTGSERYRMGGDGSKISIHGLMVTSFFFLST